MKEFKLHRTDGKTFFEFRSDPDSRCEGFTVSYLDDGTVVMSGDYGTLCWKRNYRHEKDEEFKRDYGFPNKETGIRYFDEKVCQFGIKQETMVWDKEEAVKMFKERYAEYREESEEKYDKALKQIEWLEEYDEIKFYEIVQELDCDMGEYEWKVYSSQFKFIFEALKSVSEQILGAVSKQFANDKKDEQRFKPAKKEITKEMALEIFGEELTK